jgi:hypothetical protein
LLLVFERMLELRPVTSWFIIVAPFLQVYHR